MKNVCIVGYGIIGPIHAAAINKTNSAKLYAVCDINPEKIQACKEKYDVVGYTNFDEMLKDKNINSIHICTPHYLHFEMIKKALESGKSIVCEKPVTMTSAEFEKLQKLKGADSVCCVFQNRVNPCYIRLKEIVKSGEYGKVIAVKGIVAWQRTAKYYEQDAWRGKWATEGGGVLINQAVHTLDYLCDVAGKVSLVKANMMNYFIPEIEVEDTCTAHMKFADGANGIFFATNSHGRNSPVEFEVSFEKGLARYTDSKLYINHELVEEDTEPTQGKWYWGAGHEKFMKNYYDEGKYFSIHNAKNTMDAMFAIYESAKLGGKEIIL